ncbi:MAG: phosphoenolpyruvate--protein phosphotransferase [Betaproteobacteria bacterium]|nr:phosphoenolpyruvate--protein phosphotransferase [Betaproteobacteria bacterium]
MSFTLHGIGVSGGIAIGRAHLVSHAQLEVPHVEIRPDQVPGEQERFTLALNRVRRELSELVTHIPVNAPAEFEAFLNVHLMILGDDTIAEVPRALIADQHCNAEWALKQQMEALIGQFDQIDDPYLRERKTDVKQVVERVLAVLMADAQSSATITLPEEGSILVAHDLSPADVILFKQHRFASFITDLGGTTSHTAIVARSLGIPSIVALHHARRLVRENELLIVDGTHGVLIVNPDQNVVDEFRLRQHEWELEQQKLRRLTTTRAAVLDGTRIELHANIELLEDVYQARENGAAGVGLFRTEFLYLNRGELPSEDEQFEAYRKVVMEMGRLPVTIRTFDLGADKEIEVASRVAPNPALGLRAIRLCLAEPQMFRRQLRAILRASAYGRVKILIPMLSSATELNQALHAVYEAKRSLDEDGIEYDRETPVGGMVEVPAAALSLGTFTRKLDFLSIGTNDLIQYTLAIDRTDEAVAHLYDPLHPAVLGLVASIIQTGAKADTPVAVCGEMAGDVTLTRLLLGFGLRQFSMHPANLLSVKQVVLKTDLDEVTHVAKRMLRTDDPEKLRSLLHRINSL